MSTSVKGIFLLLDTGTDVSKCWSVIYIGM